MDKLIELIKQKDNPSVVGLDPKPELIPEQLLDEYSHDRAGALADSYEAFNRAIIDAVCDIVPAVKPQIAMYEALGPVGLDVYCRTTRYAKSKGLYVIGDVKRGDIGSTAAAYAAHLSGVPFSDAMTGAEDIEDPWSQDCITVNPYLGEDGIEPFIRSAKETDKDIFILVRTSNPSSSQLQELNAEDGRPVFEHVAALVEQWGKETVGESGYSRTGAVVGATHPKAGARLREIMPHTFFLVPGFGAQGGTAKDVAAMFDSNGSGAIVNSSRGIIGAWKKEAKYSKDMNAQEALDLVMLSAQNAAIKMRNSLHAALKERQ